MAAQHANHGRLLPDGTPAEKPVARGAARRLVCARRERSAPDQGRGRRAVDATRRARDRRVFPNGGVYSVTNQMKDGSLVEVATVGHGRHDRRGGLSRRHWSGRAPRCSRCRTGCCRRWPSAGSSSMCRRPGRFATWSRDMRRPTSCRSCSARPATRCTTSSNAARRWLLQTHDRVDGDEFQLKHEFLAIMLGSHRPTVTLVLGTLQKAGLISSKYGRISILNRAGLEAASCECYEAIRGQFVRLGSGERWSRATGQGSDLAGSPTSVGDLGLPLGVSPRYAVTDGVSDRPADRADARQARDRAAGGRRVSLRAEVGRLPRDRLSRRRRRLHPEPRPAAARSLLSRAARGAARGAARRLRARRRDRDRHAARPRLRCAAAAAASGRVARREARAGDAVVVRRVRCARRRTARICATRRSASAAPRWSGCSRGVAAADPPDADDARSRAGRRVAGAVRRRGARRRDREAGRRHLPARQARDDQGQARAHRRLRRRRLPLAQGRQERAGRLAAARAVRRARAAASRRRDLVVHDGQAQAAGRGARAAARERARRSSVARVGRQAERGDESTRHAGRPEPLERGQGSVVGAAADRARLRGEVRPHAGAAVPPRGGLSALAARQAAERLPLRSARGHDSLRAREGVRCGQSPGFVDAGPVVSDDLRPGRALPAPAAALPARAEG